VRRLLLVAALVAAGCTRADTPEATPTASPEPLPPNNLSAMQALFGPDLERLGLRLTRTALIDTSEGRYSPSPEGKHLAMYAEPIEPYTSERYARNIVPLTKIFVPTVFERWSELESFDICQEPIASDEPEPPPVSQVNLTREQAQEMDWANLTLEGLIRAAIDEPSEELRVLISRRVQRSSTWRSAYRAVAGDGAAGSTGRPGY